MPVDGNEWDRGRTGETRKGKILDFLESNSDKGWSAREVALELGETSENIGGDSIWGAVASAAGVSLVKNDLEDLVREGEIEKKTLDDDPGEMDYYRAIDSE